ncbi:hypothetical protein [Microcoleus sp. bin38.metabat.b11b12b14.051]|uniref:hypothetical protein n=1 Tax=Microcoleus sp. bin38.metabat.b11b12b14.051 TaxID=2742709 RepID=UPI0025F61638|nr:hypothetical protein [Microcoleus sp. bin38.metabat.b11b12b14.051]
MSDIFVMVRNQSNVAMTSVDGIAFVTLLTQEGRLLAEEIVDLFEADVNFDELKQGKYTVVVSHEAVEPRSAICNVTITDEDRVIMVTFVYLELERVLLRIQTSTEERL